MVSEAVWFLFTLFYGYPWSCTKCPWTLRRPRKNKNMMIGEDQTNIRSLKYRRRHALSKRFSHPEAILFWRNNRFYIFWENIFFDLKKIYCRIYFEKIYYLISRKYIAQHIWRKYIAWFEENKFIVVYILRRYFVDLRKKKNDNR